MKVEASIEAAASDSADIFPHILQCDVLRLTLGHLSFFSSRRSQVPIFIAGQLGYLAKFEPPGAC